ncbi:MAG: transglycosylase [Myxococcales bacterium]|nr:transglycosylase [Myxococcales bacterium]
MARMSRELSRFLLVIAVIGCAGSTATAQLVAAKPETLSVACDDFDLPSLAAAIERELPALERSSATLSFGATPVRASDYAARTLKPLVALAKANDRANLCGALMYKYVWLHVGTDRVMFTAYHTPTVRGSLTQDATYRWPLYKRPKDAAARYTTAQILGGALAGRALELVWLADAYDALALHVEGAGMIQLPDGKMMPVGSDGHNGQAYQNVSKLLIADNRLPSGPPPPSHAPGNPKARAYFASHPADLNVYWGKNPHFVFFRSVDKAGGGRYGALVNNRSVAVDAERVPMGSLLFVRAQKPIVANGTITGWEPFSRVMLAQDTGAGIRGQRMDLYFGDDDYALAAAQAMTVQGDAWVLMSR